VPINRNEEIKQGLIWKEILLLNEETVLLKIRTY